MMYYSDEVSADDPFKLRKVEPGSEGAFMDYLEWDRPVMVYGAESFERVKLLWRLNERWQHKRTPWTPVGLKRILR